MVEGGAKIARGPQYRGRSLWRNGGKRTGEGNDRLRH